MSRIQLLGLVLALSSYTAIAKEHPESVGIAGVEPGSSTEAVTSLLGPPVSQSEILDWFELLYVYDGLEIGFSQLQVVHVRSTNADFCTEEGLCPGHTASKMKEMYGAPSVHPARPNVSAYWPHGPFCWYAFDMADELVAAVRIVCQP